MKKIGCRFEYVEERATDLLRAYRVCLAEAGSVRLADVFSRLVQMPSRRFWVSEERAAIVIATMVRRGGQLKVRMRGQKMAMYQEIYRRYIALRQRCPSAPLQTLVGRIVCSPAPCFYLTPQSAKVILFRIRKAQRERAARRSID